MASAHTTEAAAFAELAEDRQLLSRTGTAERVAEILRERVIEGLLRPGTRLPEGDISTALGVSRNTLREAFRLLSHERLLVHELNRGVFVRTPTADDVVDIFRARRFIEQTAVAGADAGELTEERLGALRTAVQEGVRAAEEHRGPDIGTANMRFHQAIGALAGSLRIDELMRQILAELRLVFHIMDRPDQFHEPYLPRNREILTLLEAHDTTQAQQALATYLDTAEEQLLAAY